MNSRIVLSFFTIALLTPVCYANDTVEIQVVSQSSSIAASLDLQAQFPGSLIGNYDPKTNPEGTLTLPGLFGGSGNQLVDLDMTGILTGEIASQPIGGYRLELDLETLTIAISDFALDLLGGEPGSLGLALGLDFETFRTFQPTSVFPGVPITLPLGDGALTELMVQQTAPAAPALLVPQGSNLYSFTLFVPAEISIESEIFGTPLNPGPVPTAVVLTGELQVDGGQVLVSQSFSQTASDIITDIQGIEFTDLPLDLPTVIPPGATAHLLLSGALESISYDLELNATLTSSGQFSEFILGDLNGDCVVSWLDVQLFVDVLTSGTYNPAADINQDGAVNLSDVAPFIKLLN